SRLVGRDAEEARSLSDIAAGEAGGARLLVVTGPPGIGKTRLVADVLATARGRTRTVEARCVSEADGGWAAPLRQLVVRALGVAPDAAEVEIRQRAEAFLAGAERAEVAA